MSTIAAVAMSRGSPSHANEPGLECYAAEYNFGMTNHSVVLLFTQLHKCVSSYRQWRQFVNDYSSRINSSMAECFQ